MPSEPPSTRPVIPAAVSSLVAALVQGEPVGATVVAAHRFALYLSVRGRVLPVVASDAVALPTAVRLAIPSGAVPRGLERPGTNAPAWGTEAAAWGVEAGQLVTVGEGRLALPGFDVVAARTWRPARVRPAPASHDECGSGCQGDHFRTHGEVDAALGARGSATGADSGWLADGIRHALAAVGCPDGVRGSHLSTQHGDVEAAVAGLLGRGAGLTPSGDDAVAGALLVAHALGTGRALADAVRARLCATTAVSAALLEAATDGYAAHPVVALVDAAVTGDTDAVRRDLPAVLAIGHTSGADTVTGIRAALDSLSPGRVCGNGCQGNHFRTRAEERAA